MPQFFDPNDLSDDHRARWDVAITQYNQIMRSNEERRLGRVISDEEWNAATTGPSLRFPRYQPGHPKSALFFRLLEGKAPLDFAPPCAFSYPWYDSVESPQPLMGVMVDLLSSEAEKEHIDALRKNREDTPVLGVIEIEHTPWEILEREGATYIVSFGEWRAQGHRWRLSKVSIPATESAQFIVCHHDKTKARITNRAELMAEAAFHVGNDIRDLQDYVDRGRPTVDPGADGLQSLRPFAKSLDDMWRQQKERYAAKVILEREATGRSTVPVGAEVVRMVEERFAQYLKSDASLGQWRIDDEGLLHSESWELESLGAAGAGAHQR